MTTKTWAYVALGCVAEVISLDASLTPGKDIFTPAFAATLIDATAVVGIAAGWSYDGNAFTPPAFQGPSLPQLIGQLLAAAAGASTAITKQIATTEAHLAGYQSAANMVQVAGGVPTVDPAKTAFAGLASALGMPTPQLASLVLAMDAASVLNLTILATLSSAVAKANSATDLAAAIAAYEGSLTAFVATLNSSGLTTTIAAPAPIIIPGINA